MCCRWPCLCTSYILECGGVFVEVTAKCQSPALKKIFDKKHNGIVVEHLGYVPCLRGGVIRRGGSSLLTSSEIVGDLEH